MRLKKDKDKDKDKDLVFAKTISDIFEDVLTGAIVSNDNTVTQSSEDELQAVSKVKKITRSKFFTR